MPVGRKEVAAMTRMEQRSTTSPSSPNHRRPLDLRRPSSREQGKGAPGALSRSRRRCLQSRGGLCSPAFAHCSWPEENGRERRRRAPPPGPLDPGAQAPPRATRRRAPPWGPCNPERRGGTACRLVWGGVRGLGGPEGGGEGRRHGSPTGVGRGQGTGRAEGRQGREEARLAGRAGSAIRRRWGRRRRVGRWR
jgi:hypothetical protein